MKLEARVDWPQSKQFCAHFLFAVVAYFHGSKRSGHLFARTLSMVWIAETVPCCGEFRSDHGGVCESRGLVWRLGSNFALGGKHERSSGSWLTNKSGVFGLVRAPHV